MERNEVTAALANKEVVFFMVCQSIFSDLVINRYLVCLICKMKSPGICTNNLPGVWGLDLTLFIVKFLDDMINRCISHVQIGFASYGSKHCLVLSFEILTITCIHEQTENRLIPGSY